MRLRGIAEQKFQAQLDADAESELKRERKKIDLRERKTRQEKEDAESRRQAEVAEADQRVAVERQRLYSMLEVKRSLAAEEEWALRQREEICTDGKRNRADIETNVLRERQRLLKIIRTTVTQLQLSPHQIGMILGEISDGLRLLTER